MQHALLGPSSASRWLACPPSARLSELYPNTSSTAAEEGTLAHSLGETELTHFLGRISKEKYDAELLRISKDPLYSVDMPDHVDKYVSLVKSWQCKGAFTYIEKRVDFSKYVPQGFGTSDACVVSGKLLRFADLKYGLGVKVFAKDNPQLKLYAIGLLETLGFLHEDIEMVELHIVQPRLDHHDVFLISVKDLYEWAETYVQPRALMAWNGQGQQKAGDHCKFCPAKAKCRTLAEFGKNINEKFRVKDPRQLSDDEISELYRVNNLVNLWLKEVSSYMLTQSLLGNKFKGFKLVEGRSNRQFTDSKSVENVLLLEGFKVHMYKPREMKTLTELEKLMGKPTFKDLLGRYVHKPKGAPTLVEESDPRAEYNPRQISAEEAFASPIEE